MPYTDRTVGKYRMQEEVKQRTVRVFDGLGIREFSYEVTTSDVVTARVTNGSGAMTRKLWQAIAIDLRDNMGFSFGFYEEGEDGEPKVWNLHDIKETK